MNEKTTSPRFDGPVRSLAIIGGVLAAISILAGVAMLLMTWAQLNPPYVLTWLTLILLPIAFLLMLTSLILLMVRRKTT
ncbi:hypothetical protein [Rothia amarae]|uniref:hypothetical protein n=1 Tax=Rothia amarae TaxID=169480 RepID=UPI0009290EA3|nr:Uncharacterised protein [Mycobacteroides abscessus subsp. abscessus]